MRVSCIAATRDSPPDFGEPAPFGVRRGHSLAHARPGPLRGEGRKPGARGSTGLRQGTCGQGKSLLPPVPDQDLATAFEDDLAPVLGDGLEPAPEDDVSDSLEDEEDDALAERRHRGLIPVATDRGDGFLGGLLRALEDVGGRGGLGAREPGRRCR